MRTLYLECNMGAAGDMLTGALLELVDHPDDIVQKLSHLGLSGVSVRAVPSTKCGIVGTHMEVTVNGEEEHSNDVHLTDHEAACHPADAACSPAGGQSHGHAQSEQDSSENGHAHVHGHHHHHTHPEDVRRIVSQMDLPEEVRADVLAVYQSIADAEAHAHHMPVDQIHFHEVGTLDAILDVTAVCLLMHELRPDAVIASPVCTGFGEVRCAHGILPVPAPATAYLLTGIPTYSGAIEGEMCTPTGAALLRHFVKRFEERPEMTVQKIGYGMGSKDFPRANCIRAFLGETPAEKIAEDASEIADHASDHPSGSRIVPSASCHDQIIELRCNLDDMSGEDIGYAVSRIMDAGARDVFTTPIGMKKNRPGILLTVICSPADREKMVEEIFRQTTTIGIRETVCNRYILNREESLKETAAGEIHVKTSSGYGVVRTKPEYDDIAAIAGKSGKSPAEVRHGLHLE